MEQSMTVGELDFYIEKIVSKTPLHNMHHHRSYELYYMLKGQREYFIEDRFFVINEGDLVLIPKNVFHRTAGEGGLRFLVHFSEAFLERWVTPASLQPLLEELPPVFRGEELQRSQLAYALNQILIEHTRAELEHVATDDQLLAGYLYQILFTMRYCGNTYVPENYTDERISDIVHYINENYNSIGDVESIAREFYISKYYLCRLFKKSLGISLISYLNTIKIRNACRMIKEGITNLTEVAMRCGFNFPPIFVRCLTRRLACLPRIIAEESKERIYEFCKFAPAFHTF